jgi:transcriptional regulator with XRE-family HTH domain
MSVIGDNIRALRTLYGSGREMTQAELADIIGVTRETVNKWEAGTVGNVRADNLSRLCRHFGVSADDLRSETNGLAAKLQAKQQAKYNRAQCTAGLNSFAAPLVELFDLTNDADEVSPGAYIEVPSALYSRPRKLRAFIVEDDAMALVLPKGSHAVVDLIAEPKSGSLAVVILCDDSRGPLVRRIHCGTTKAILSSEGIAAAEDMVLDIRAVRILGVVIWYQAAMVLG